MAHSQITSTTALAAVLAFAVVAAGYAAGAARSSVYKFESWDTAPHRTCSMAGGAFLTDSSGVKVCVLPAPVPAGTANAKGSAMSPIDPADPNGEKTCKDGGGAVFANRAGVKTCISPAPAPGQGLCCTKP